MHLRVFHEEMFGKTPNIPQGYSMVSAPSIANWWMAGKKREISTVCLPSLVNMCVYKCIKDPPYCWTCQAATLILSLLLMWLMFLLLSHTRHKKTHTLFQTVHCVKLTCPAKATPPPRCLAAWFSVVKCFLSRMITNEAASWSRKPPSLTEDNAPILLFFSAFLSPPCPPYMHTLATASEVLFPNLTKSWTWASENNRW